MPLSRTKAACTFHDRVNLLALPVLGTLAAAGVFGLYSATKVTNMFVMYIVADALWICVEPDALPSLPQVVIAHHFVTIIILLFPLRHPEFAYFTCWDGVVEINTFFLIARRQWKAQRKYMNWCYLGNLLAYADGAVPISPFPLLVRLGGLWPGKSTSMHMPVSSMRLQWRNDLCISHEENTTSGQQR